MHSILVNGPQGRNQFEIFSTKFLAFAAEGVRPEPSGWPGKATLRPVDTLLRQVKIANIVKCAFKILISPPNKFSTRYFYHFIGTFRILFVSNKASKIY